MTNENYKREKDLIYHSNLINQTALFLLQSKANSEVITHINYIVKYLNEEIEKCQ